MKVFWIILLIIGTVIILGLLALVLPIIGVHLAAKAPSNNEIRGVINNILGCDIGKEYEVVKLDYRFAHSDRPTSAIIRVPEEKFNELVEQYSLSADENTDDYLIKRNDIYNEDYCVLYQSVRLDKRDKSIYFSSVGC